MAIFFAQGLKFLRYKISYLPSYAIYAELHMSKIYLGELPIFFDFGFFDKTTLISRKFS